VWDEEYCIIDDKFRDAVSEAVGFAWVDEAKPHHLTRKWGFVATQPGSHLLLTVNTAETTKSDVRRPSSCCSTETRLTYFLSNRPVQ